MLPVRQVRRPGSLVASLRFRSVAAVGIAIVMASTALAESGVASASGDDAVSFSRQVLPILSDKCFACHGPDTHDPDMIRLDSFDAASEDRGGYRGIDPQSPERSVVLQRIHDADDPMPPADFDKQLTDAERDVLSRWIAQGGKYDLHWAYAPPIRFQPKSGPTTTVRDTIDAFVGEQLAANGVDFAPEADRATLARRVALVLTGLPPEPEQLADFMADDDSGAYERFVERMLASPRFGEHQARYWLDAVRYGDTHGLHLDNRRGIYPYRDWVVRAFNDNLPFDDFLVWQLAGDKLPNPTLDQQIATGFVRMNPTTAEGGAIPEEFQAKNNFDRTETLGTVLLGMTLSCARCHTHKYDPITQTEYYRLFAFFNSTAEPPMDANAYAFGPVLEVPADDAAYRRWNDLNERAAALLGDRKPTPEAIDAARAGRPWNASGWQLHGPAAVGSEPPADDGWEGTDKLPGRTDRALPATDSVLRIRCDVEMPRERDLWLVGRFGASLSIRIDDRNAAVESFGVPGELSLHRVRFPAGKSRLMVETAGDGSGAMLEARLIDPWESTVANGTEAATPVDRLLIAYESSADPSSMAEGPELARRMMIERAGFTTTLVARDLPSPRLTHVLRRGEYDQPIGDPLDPSVPAIMGSLPDDRPADRLALAQWLVSDQHPLVRRVLVNGFWQRVFGHGLVRTPEDFGVQGAQPTHPELLDRLAIEFSERGWDLKLMLREMVNSRTFRQESRLRSDLEDPENRLLARGPRYRLDAEVLRDLGLWAADLLDPSLGGEGVRIYQPEGMWEALGHPASNTLVYVQDHGSKLYRRSLYVYWKRTSPHPMMTLFDAPDRESSCVRRTRSSTALQSLALFNETQRVEIARSVAMRLLSEPQDDSARVDRLIGLVACRAASDGERQACLNLLSAMRRRYAESPDDAAAILAIGEAPMAADVDPIETAAWSQVAATVLASDLSLMLY
jgi:hypothetical protein